MYSCLLEVLSITCLLALETKAPARYGAGAAKQASSQDLDCYAELIAASALNGLPSHRSLGSLACHAQIGAPPPKRQKIEKVFRP